MNPSSLQIFRELGRSSMLLALLGLGFGCRPVVSGTDPQALGYGSGDRFGSMSGYDNDPVPRAEPTPWTPPTRDPRGSFLAQPADAAGGDALAPAPTPHTTEVVQVCAQLERLGDAPEDRQGCLRRHRIARVFRTISDWKTLAACVLASEDRDAAAACEVQTPPAFPIDPQYPRESQVCLHVFALTIIEELGAEPMLGSAELLEFQPLLAECVQAFVEDERSDRNPTQYNELLACMEASNSLAEADDC